MPNPSAVFCSERGHTYEIRKDEAGNDYGVCIFSSGTECDAWNFYRGECEAITTPLFPQPTETIHLAPVETVNPDEMIYQDDEYRIVVTYPEGWALDVSTIRQDSEAHPLSKLLQFSRENWLLSVHYKFIGDVTVISGGIGAGDIVEDGSISLLGQKVSVKKLVYADQTIMVWVGARLSDLEVYAKLEDANQHDYDEINIPPEIWGEAAGILSALTRTGESFPMPMDAALPSATQAPDICPLPPLLMTGFQAQVTPGLPNALRSAPGRGMDSLVIGEIQAGTIMKVLDGPVCSDGFYWWKVDVDEQVGWTAEGQDPTYWLLPYTTAEGEVVDGWVGVIVNAPDWPQIDDYFQMLDQNGSRYGITALDPALGRELGSYRDTGILVRVWGTLYMNRMDAYNTQIEVDRFDVYED